jgi:hypothetical protein
MGQWTPDLTYATTSDGKLTEGKLFARVATMRDAAAALYAKCTGSPVQTDVIQEQSFHACW